MGRKVLFLERRRPGTPQNRDLPDPDFCELAFYSSLTDLEQRFAQRIADAGAVIVGSYVPDGIAVIDLVLGCAAGVTGFYDIDTPITLAALDAGDAAYLAARQIPLLDLYFSFTGGPTLDRLARCFGAQQPCALYCAVDDVQCRPIDAELRWDLGYLGTYSPDRQPALERLLLEPARRMPRHAVRRGGAAISCGNRLACQRRAASSMLPPAEHAAFYAASALPEHYTRGDDRGRMVAQRAAVRGGGVRHADHQRSVGWSGRSAARACGRTDR